MNDRTMLLWKTTRFLAFLLFVSTAHRLLAADPQAQDPFDTLGVHGVVPEAKTLHERLSEHDASIRASITKIYASTKEIKERDFCQLYVKVEQYRRWQRWLSECREAAARDFQFRERVYSQKLQEIAVKFWSSPSARVAQQKVLQKLTRANSNRLKQLEKILKTLEGGDARRAEEQYYQLHDSIFSEAAVLAATQKKTLNEQLSQVRGPVDAAMVPVRKEAAVQAFAKDREKFQSYCSAIVKKLSSAVAEHEANSNPQGTALLQQVCTDWRNAHRGLVRLATLHSDTEKAEELYQRILKALEQHVASEANRIDSTESAKEKYHQYRVLLADVAARQSAPDFAARMQTALRPLAEKAGIAGEVRAYTLATTDLLRWRSRVAAAKARLAMENTSTPAELSRANLSDGVNAVSIYGTTGESPVLLKAIPETIPAIVQGLVGKSVHVSEVMRLDSEAELSMSRIRDGFFAKVDHKMLDHKMLSTDEAVSKLKRDLLLGAQDKPLTIEATMALQTAVQGDFQHAAGTITGVSVEAAQARMASLPNVASRLVAWDEVGQLHSNSGSQGHASQTRLLIRLDIEPAWVQHRYFFVGDASFGDTETGENRPNSESDETLKSSDGEPTSVNP